MDTQFEIGRAKEAASNGDYPAAQNILKQVLTQDPQNLSAWLALADVLQNPEHAVECLQRVLKIDPENQIAHHKIESYQQTPSQTSFAPNAQALENRLQQVTQSEIVHNDPWKVDVINPSTTSASIRTDLPATKPEPEKRSEMKPPQKSKKLGRWLEISLIALLIMCAACVFSLVIFKPKLTAVQGGQITEGLSPTPENVTAVIFENIRASNTENYARYMATIHSKSPGYKSTEAMTKEAFSLFDLSYKISRVKVIDQKRDKAVVAFVLTTKKIRGPSFRDNRITGEMILRKENGVWKIYDQKVHNITYLN
jgi:tetratricopeptide (TPR) repeat protein